MSANLAWNPNEEFESQSDMFIARILEILAGISPNVYAVIEEYVANSQDAGATEIYIALERDRIVISDNGHGMVPLYLPEDEDTIQKYKEDIAQGKADIDFDVREIISEATLKSLRWLSECIGLSPKPFIQGQNIQGMRGIGSIGWRQLGDKAEFYSRPSQELAAIYYNDPNEVRNPPCGIWRPASETQRKRFDLKGTIRIEKRKLYNPRGKELESGTVIEITDLKPDRMVTPVGLADYLRTRFSEAIRRKVVKIIVLDKVTPSGIKAGGLETIVSAVPYDGRNIINENLGLPNMPFEARIWYAQDGKNGKVMFRRREADVNELANIPGIPSEFRNGTLSGYVTYPDLPEDVAPLSADKRVPLQSQVFTRWLREVRALVPLFEAEIESLRQQQEEEHQKRVMEAISTAIMDSMLELPQFQGTVIGIPETRTRTQGGDRTGGQRSPRMVERVMASVMNEHNQGVANVTLELSFMGREIETRTTGVSGHVSFHKLTNLEAKEKGYTLRVIIPEDMSLHTGLDRYRLNLSTSKPGARVVFHLITGQPRTEDRVIRQLNFRYRELPGDEPYSIERMADGTVIINNSTDEYVATQGAEREDYIALCTAGAVTEYSLGKRTQDPHYIMSQTMLLYTKARRKMRQNMRGSGRTRRKRTTR